MCSHVIDEHLYCSQMASKLVSIPQDKARREKRSQAELKRRKSETSGLDRGKRDEPTEKVEVRTKDRGTELTGQTKVERIRFCRLFYETNQIITNISSTIFVLPSFTV